MVCSTTLSAQEILTIEEAITIAVENNYDVQIARNNTEISKVESELLNSGYLPSVSAVAGVDYRDESQNVTFSDGSSTSVTGAITESYNASITAEYTIFDGLERKFNTQKNTENYNYKKLQERQSIENTIISIYQEYYNVAYQQQVTENLRYNIANSMDRLERTKRQLKYGQGTKLDELNAQVDVNNDSISYVSAEADFNNAKRNLNLLLGRNVITNYVIDTTVIFRKKFTENEVISQTENNNIESLLGKQNVLLSDLDIEINKAKFLPKINGTLGYAWNQSINPPTNFALENEAYGVNLGLNLSWNIFDGGKNKTKTKTTKINKLNREIELLKAKEELKTEAYNAFTDYQNKQFTLKAEEKNVATNKLNFSRTKRQFSLGHVSAVEFRNAQINLFNALNNFAKAKYDLKIAEIILTQLCGRLIS